MMGSGSRVRRSSRAGTANRSQAAGPHPRIRDIIRRCARPRGPVTNDGPHYPLPYRAARGFGKPLKPITHPLRSDLPILLGAEGPKNVALAAEICRRLAADLLRAKHEPIYSESLEEGFSRPAPVAPARLRGLARPPSSSPKTSRAPPFIRRAIALYMGGMGAEEVNFHAGVYERMGYADVVDEVTALFRSGQKDGKERAAEIIPDEVIDDAAIVGDADYVRKQIKAWEAAGVTMMVVSGRSTAQVQELASLI